jgi:hypothetical protein
MQVENVAANLLVTVTSVRPHSVPLLCLVQARVPVRCLKGFVVLKGSSESQPSMLTQAVTLVILIPVVLTVYLGRATDYTD